MSEVIQGSKSSLYIKEQIPGILDSADSFTHQSVQNLWSGRGASDVLIHAFYPTSAIASTVEAGSVKRLIKVTGHNAKAGDQIRMNNGGADSEEVAIVKIVDANFFVIAKEISASVGDELFILKPVTPTYTKTGSLVVSQGPVQFVKDSLAQQVVEDTVAPANNEPLPNKLFFQKDGVTYPVNKDTAVPGNTAAIPVEIVGASGQVINITAGDINVQTSHLGAGFDSVRIGDGTNIVSVDAVNALKTDSSHVTQPVSATNLDIRDLVFATDKADVSGSTVTVTATDLDVRNLVFATDKVDVSGSSITVTATDLDVRNLVFATDKVDASGSSVAVSNTVTVSATDLDVRNLVFATDKVDSSGSSVSNLPATIGQQTSAASLSVVLSSDHASVPVTVAGTVAVAQGALSSFYVEVTNLTTTNQFILSGVTCKKIYIQADSDNTANIRMKITNSATVATVSSGWKLEPGRSESFDMGGSSLNCSVGIIAESGTNQKVYVQYGN